MAQGQLDFQLLDGVERQFTVNRDHTTIATDCGCALILDVAGNGLRVRGVLDRILVGLQAPGKTDRAVHQVEQFAIAGLEFGAQQLGFSSAVGGGQQLLYVGGIIPQLERVVAAINIGVGDGVGLELAALDGGDLVLAVANRSLVIPVAQVALHAEHGARSIRSGLFANLAGFIHRAENIQRAAVVSGRWVRMLNIARHVANGHGDGVGSIAISDLAVGASCVAAGERAYAGKGRSRSR